MPATSSSQTPRGDLSVAAWESFRERRLVLRGPHLRLVLRFFDAVAAGLRPCGWPMPSPSARSMAAASCFFTGRGGLRLGAERPAAEGGFFLPDCFVIERPGGAGPKLDEGGGVARQCSRL